MKNKFTLSVFIIIPVLLFIMSCKLKDYQGLYFTRGQYDPSYTYLISSLNLSQFSGYGVGHVDHPGTPLQVIGAIVIKIAYHLDHQEKNLPREVLLNPEKYLDKIDFVLIIINCLGLFVLGVVSYKVYSNVLISLLLQLLPFTSTSILAHFTYVRPENFLVFVICIFISALILFINEPDINPRKNLKYLIVLGIVTGLGIATKITFFPLVIIPIMLFRGIKFKLLFLAIVSISFLIFVIPAISSENIKYFVQWIYSLFVHTKKYGRGKPTIVDPYSFLHNIKTIFLKEWFFDFAYFSVCSSIALSLLPKFKIYRDKLGKIFPKDADNKLLNEIGFENDIKLKLAMGIFLAMTLQIVIVAKHYGNNYMFPVLTFSVLAIFTSISILSAIFGKMLTKRKMNIIYLILIFIISLNGINCFRTWGNYNKILTEESDKLLNYVEKNLDDSIIVTAIRVSSMEFAFWGSLPYAGTQIKNYQHILDTRYSTSIFYYNDKCYTFSEDTSKIEKTFKSADKIIFLCPDENYLNKFLELLHNDYGVVNTTYEKKFSNMNGEVYEIEFED